MSQGRFQLSLWTMIAFVSLMLAVGCNPAETAKKDSPRGSSDRSDVPSAINSTNPSAVPSGDAEAQNAPNIAVQPSEPGELIVLEAPEEVVSPQRSISQPTLGAPIPVAKAPEQPTLADPTLAELTLEEPKADTVPAETVSTGTNVVGSAATFPEPPQHDSHGSTLATHDERNQAIAPDWPQPQAVLYVSGQQQGYIEPCGCTGLENQKGGLIRRDTLITSLRERGWNVVPIDVGNQVRRKGRQPLIKFETTARAFQQMGYEAVALGASDLRLSKVDLVQIAASGGGKPRPFIGANVTVLLPDLFPAYKVVESGGRKIGITAFIGSEFREELAREEVEFRDPVESLKAVLPILKDNGCDIIVLLAHASIKESAEVAAALSDVDLVVTAGGYGEPTRDPEPIEGSSALMVQVGTKGMYGGIIGLFDDPKQPIRYQRIAISSQFKDSERMLVQFAKYQETLQEIGFQGLGLRPARHGSDREFVGTEKCGECHTHAYEVWKNSPHFHATDDIVKPNNDRGGIARHFDPECLSCHVTGWNPQEYTPYESGFVDLQASSHLLGSGCENCHGPGSAHVAAEQGDIDTTPELLKELQQEMVLSLAKAPEKCVECHDLDNSPAFHEEGAFEQYWERVKHYGKD